MFAAGDQLFLVKCHTYLGIVDYCGRCPFDNKAKIKKKIIAGTRRFYMYDTYYKW